MASEVYSPTTAPNPKSSWLRVPSDNLDKTRCGIKVLEVLLSFVAFILEEVVNSCISCSALYFFEFVSCTAFLFTLLLLILLATTLHTRVGISCWPSLDFGYTLVIAVLFLIASIVFASDNSNTTMERSAVAFGFLATVLFFVDLALFVKSRGFPFKKEGKPASTNGVAAASTPPEAEKLTTAGNGAE
ncbi:CKLF-like MARVEL transmembrane domain-containing protein 6 [Symphorus nematophorus]